MSPVADLFQEIANCVSPVADPVTGNGNCACAGGDLLQEIDNCAYARGDPTAGNGHCGGAGGEKKWLSLFSVAKDLVRWP